MLLDGSLEDEEARRGGRIALRGRSDVDDELHQPADADVGLCGNAEDRHRLAAEHTGGQTLADLVGGKLHRFEEFLHQFIGTFGGLLHQFGAKLLGLVRIGGGNVEFLVLRVVELHRDDIDDAFEARARVDRELAQDRALAEFLAESGTDAVPVGFLMVELVDRDDHRLAVLFRIAGENRRTDLHASRSVHHEDGTLDNLEGGKGTAAEIVRTGSVNDIDLAVLELCIERGGIDGFLVRLLELRIVGNGVLVFNGSTAVDHFAFEKHGFG